MTACHVQPGNSRQTHRQAPAGAETHQADGLTLAERANLIGNVVKSLGASMAGVPTGSPDRHV